jgi:hypothetical protein
MLSSFASIEVSRNVVLKGDQKLLVAIHRGDSPFCNQLDPVDLLLFVFYQFQTEIIGTFLLGKFLWFGKEFFYDLLVHLALLEVVWIIFILPAMVAAGVVNLVDQDVVTKVLAALVIFDKTLQVIAGDKPCAKVEPSVRLHRQAGDVTAGLQNARDDPGSLFWFKWM